VRTANRDGKTTRGTSLRLNARPSPGA
jgi:hypothetical protein